MVPLPQTKISLPGIDLVWIAHLDNLAKCDVHLWQWCHHGLAAHRAAHRGCAKGLKPLGRVDEMLQAMPVEGVAACQSHRVNKVLLTNCTYKGLLSSIAVFGARGIAGSTK